MEKPKVDPPLRYPRKPPVAFRKKKQISLNFGHWEDRHEPSKRAEARATIEAWERR